MNSKNEHNVAFLSDVYSYVIYCIHAEIQVSDDVSAIYLTRLSHLSAECLFSFSFVFQVQKHRGYCF